MRSLPGSRSVPIMVRELLIVVGLLRAYDIVREHAYLRQVPAILHGQALLDAERSAGLDLERFLSVWTAEHHLVELVASTYYQYAHVTVTMAVLLWTWVRHPAFYGWARTSLVLINLAGLTVFFLYPVAPPRLLPGSGVVDGAVTVGRASVIANVHADQYGAMPSLHFAWAVWVAAVLWRVLGPRWRLATVYPVLTSVVVVVTGNHYLLDLPAGAAVAAVALAHPVVVRRITARRARPGEIATPAAQQSVLVASSGR